MNACKSCGAPIRWTTTPGRRAMPLDRDPIPHGNVRLLADGTAEVLGAGAAWDGVEARYVSHFATCPAADEHRKSA